MPTTQKPKQTKATQKAGGKSPIVRAKAQAKTSAKVGGGPHNRRDVNLPEVIVPYTKKIEFINTRLNEIESTQRSLGKFYAELSSNITELFTEITAIKGLDLKQRLDNLEDKVSDHDGKITINHSFDARIKNLENAISRTSTNKPYK